MKRPRLGVVRAMPRRASKPKETEGESDILAFARPTEEELEWWDEYAYPDWYYGEYEDG